MPISVHEYKALYLKTSMQCVAAIRASLARYGTAECDVDTHVTECHRMAHVSLPRNNSHRTSLMSVPI